MDNRYTSIRMGGVMIALNESLEKKNNYTAVNKKKWKA